MARILVVDDESLVRALAVEVGSSLGHEVFTAANIRDGLALARQNMDIVLLDVLLPDGDGLATLESFTRLRGHPDVIVITGHGNADAAETALRAGAWEYLLKPLRPRDLKQALSQVVAWRASRGEAALTRLRHPDIIGESRALSDALEQVREAAASNVNVLIVGETGVGKELFARALHANSARAAHPFITVDCTTLPETLVEAHLFGHARGAFTGADRARDGLLTAADGGTLFLDEVGDLPLPVQGAFLRALELRRFRPVGEVREVRSDFRIVAATNRDLDDMARMDLFRSDLRFRLRGMTILVPPLRRRVEDIPLLAGHMLADFCLRHNLPRKELAPGCLEALTAYPWPGNVRELGHALERACTAAGGGDQIFARHLPTEIRIELARRRIPAPSLPSLNPLSPQPAAYDLTDAPEEAAPAPRVTDAAAPDAAVSDSCAMPDAVARCFSASFMSGTGSVPTLREVRARTEARYVQALFEACAGDARKAARLAGISRGHFYELLRKHTRIEPA